MTTNFNYIKCPKCEHDRNPVNAAKCEICGNPLGKNKSPVAAIALGLATLGILGTGGYFFKDRIPGLAPKPVTSSSPTVVTPDQTASNSNVNSATQPSLNAKSSQNPTQVQGAVVSTYKSLVEVQNVPQGLFNYGGSTTFAPLRGANVVAAINQAHPQFRTRYTEPTVGKPGSGKGIEMLINGQLSFAQSSRSLKDEEYARAKGRGFTLEEVPVALDGIAIYVNPRLMNQGVKGLTVAQVRDIFTGKIRNWQQVGGPNLPIVPFSRNLQSGGTVDFFSETVLEKQPFAANTKEVRDTTNAIRKVATTPGGISFATTSEVINQQMIRLMPLAKGEGGQKFVSPCADSTCTAINERVFTDNSYPITRRLFVIIKRDGRLDEQAGVAYANMLLSDEGQKLAGQVGFVPIR